MLAGAEATGEEFSLLLSHAPPGDSAPLHVHDRDSESFYVLAGAYRIECGPDTFEAGPGDFAYLPRGVPHAWEVTSRVPATKLILAVPASLDRFFADLVSGADAEQLAHRHGVRFLT